MKHLLALTLSIAVSYHPGRAQGYDTVRLGFETSVNLIFPTPVRQWDMGLGTRVEEGRELWDVLVRNHPDSPQRIKLAAAIKNFATTNLFVETEKAYYNFILVFDPNPQDLLIQVDLIQAAIIKADDQVPGPTPKNAQVEPASISRLEALGSAVEHLPDQFTYIGQASQKMIFYLAGIYISGEHLLFKVMITNKGTIPYDIGYEGFHTADKGSKGTKRRPRQDEPQQPVYIHNDQDTVVHSGETLIKVYVFQKFTLDKQKNLYIQFWEGNRGERKVEMVVTSQDLLAAKKM